MTWGQHTGIDPFAARTPAECLELFIRFLEAGLDELHEGRRRSKESGNFRISAGDRDDYWFYKIASLVVYPEVLGTLKALNPNAFADVPALRGHLQAQFAQKADDAEQRCEVLRRNDDPMDNGDEGTSWVFDTRREIYERLAQFVAGRFDA